MGETVESLSEASVTVICLDRFQEYDWSGRLYVRSKAEACFFRSTLELFELMEENYDKLDYPQASMNNRRFSSNAGTRREKRGTEQKSDRNFRVSRKGEQPVVLSKEDLQKKRGERATFLVRVQYRQSATWQGRATWVEKNRTSSFRSALELLKLIDNAKTEKEQNAKA